MIKIAVVYHSSSGYTKKIADNIAKGVKERAVGVVTLTTAMMKDNLKSLDDCHGIIFGSPTYFGSVSSEFKEFMDSTSDIWLKQKWKDKIAAAFTCANSPSGDQLNTLMQLCIFSCQHGMIWTGSDLMTKLPEHGHDPDIYNKLGSWLGFTFRARDEMGEKSIFTESDIKTSIHFGKRIAEVTKRFYSKG